MAYFVNCRFLKASTLHPRVLHGNRIAYASIFSTLALVVSKMGGSRGAKRGLLTPGCGSRCEMRLGI